VGVEKEGRRSMMRGRKFKIKEEGKRMMRCRSGVEEGVERMRGGRLG
jgi:hypothetical protein